MQPQTYGDCRVNHANYRLNNTRNKLVLYDIIKYTSQNDTCAVFTLRVSLCSTCFMHDVDENKKATSVYRYSYIPKHVVDVAIIFDNFYDPTVYE